MDRTQLNSVELRLEFDPELPITAMHDDLIRMIRENQVIVVCGETGSGKSTQLPKLCLEAGYGRTAMIGHTQPRRLAARSIAQRLRQEIEVNTAPPGFDRSTLVGFKIRFTDATSPSTMVKLMTDGVLLNELSRDRLLKAYDVIIIDEAHERSLNIDLLLAYLHRLLPERPDLRLIITSATIDAEKFAEHFSSSSGPAPIVMVSGRTYDVDIRYLGNSSDQDDSYSFDERFLAAVDSLLSEMRGDILAFFPAERDIRFASKLLRGHLTSQGRGDRIEILPLYSRLTESEQQRVFQPHSQRRIVLATNVAESSLTVPGIYSVIDTGTARISRYAPRSKVQRLPIEPISQASANQRAGRCGRLAPGICIRLYDESDFLARSPYTTPEIRRTDLSGAILQTELLGIGQLESLPLLDPPRPEMIRDGLATLHEIGAIDDEDRITRIGRRLGHWPVSPRVGRMIIEADQNGCLNDVLIIAAALESQDPRLRPPESQSEADSAHDKFRDPHSDFISYLRIWDFYHRLKEELGRSRLERACQNNYLSLPRMREWIDVHRQLVQMTQQIGFSVKSLRKISVFAEAASQPDFKSTNRNQRNHPNTNESTPVQGKPTVEQPRGYNEVHQSLLAGLLSGIAYLDDQKKYKGAGGIELQLWPGSGVRSLRPKWIVASEIVETTQRYARSVAMIDQEWVERLAEHLIKYQYDQPHFSRKQGRAMIYQRGTLFGLPIVARRPVPLSHSDPKLARRLLIDDGLIERELNSRAKFVTHNWKMLEDVQEWAAKTRRRDLVIDTYWLQQFYDEHLPLEIVDRASLEKWDSTTKQPHPIYMSWETLVDSLDRNRAEQDYPNMIAIGPTELPVEYRFEPGAEQDGVTVRVPEAALTQLSDDRLAWLVPGLLNEKVQGLIKSLPKNLRRNLVPAPDVALRVTRQLQVLQQQQQPFWPALCDVLSKEAGEKIKKEDFDLQRLDQHLHVRVEVIDEKGDVKIASRDLTPLLPTKSPAAPVTIATQDVDKTKLPWFREKLTSFDIDELPASIVVNQSGLKIPKYVALLDQGAYVTTALYESELQAQEIMKTGLVRLFSLADNRELKSQVNHLPQLDQCQIWLASRMTTNDLRNHLQDLIARIAFVEDMPHAKVSNATQLRSKDAFDLQRMDRLKRISNAVVEVGKWLPKFSQSYHTMRLNLQSAPKTWQNNVDDMHSQLNELFQPGFMMHVPWDWLKEYPRYFQAINARIERLKTIGASQDAKLQDQVRGYWEAYQSKLKKSDQTVWSSSYNSTGQASNQPINNAKPNSTAPRVTKFELTLANHSLSKLSTSSKQTNSTQTSSSKNLNNKKSAPAAVDIVNAAVPNLTPWPTGVLLQFRWMIEEFRVSLSAQNLGTKVSVSPKRLDKSLIDCE